MAKQGKGSRANAKARRDKEKAVRKAYYKSLATSGEKKVKRIKKNRQAHNPNKGLHLTDFCGNISCCKCFKREVVHYSDGTSRRVVRPTLSFYAKGHFAKHLCAEGG
jgi:hypothetical protein